MAQSDVTDWMSCERDDSKADHSWEGPCRHSAGWLFLCRARSDIIRSSRLLAGLPGYILQTTAGGNIRFLFTPTPHPHSPLRSWLWRFASAGHIKRQKDEVNLPQRCHCWGATLSQSSLADITIRLWTHFTHPLFNVWIGFSNRLQKVIGWSSLGCRVAFKKRIFYFFIFFT